MNATTDTNTTSQTTPVTTPTMDTQSVLKQYKIKRPDPNFTRHYPDFVKTMISNVKQAEADTTIPAVVLEKLVEIRVAWEGLLASAETTFAEEEQKKAAQQARRAEEHKAWLAQEAKRVGFNPAGNADPVAPTEVRATPTKSKRAVFFESHPLALDPRVTIITSPEEAKERMEACNVAAKAAKDGGAAYDLVNSLRDWARNWKEQERRYAYEVMGGEQERKGPKPAAIAKKNARRNADRERGSKMKGKGK